MIRSMRSTSWCIAACLSWLAACAGAPTDTDVAASSDALRLAPGHKLTFEAFDDPQGVAPAGDAEVRRVITSAAQYARVLGHAAPADVDFAGAEIVVLYSAGVKRTGGYAASVELIELRLGRLIVTTRLESPGEDCRVTEALTHPYALVKLQRPRGLLRAHFQRDDATLDCEPAGQFCGGIAGFPCPEPLQCIDDPNDDCDPQQGGADCGGVCACVQTALCVRGFAFDSSPKVCACVPDPSQDPCAAVRCKAGTHCEPSDDGAVCVSDGPDCGGIAGFPCPGSGKCVDDPSDDCDPQQGGADCGGVCTCVENVLCIRGDVFDPSPKVCACVPAPEDPCAATLCPTNTRCEVSDGSAVCVSNGKLACGPTTCADGSVCCNASCGMCTAPNMACIQIACLPQP